MRRILCLPALAFLLAQTARGEVPAIDDAAIRKSFLEQIVALKDTGNSGGMNAATLRRELKREKRGLAGFDFPAPQTTELNRQELYAAAKKSTLIVGHIYLCDSCDKWHTNLAGGVVLSNDGVVATNFHVLQFEKAALFAAMDHELRLFPIREVLASDKQSDLAVLQLDITFDLKPAPLAQGSGVGETIGIVSHPDAHFFSYTVGGVSRFSINPKTKAKRIEVTAPFARGSSGSGIFDFRGNLIGIASATNAIYYEEDDREQRNLQMVIHSGVPASSLFDLITGN